MVSIRKWRHLGVQERYKILNQLSRLNERKRAMEPKVVVEEIPYQSCESNILEKGHEENLVLEAEPSPSFSMCDNSIKDLNNAFQGHPLRIRKASRRKQSENQDPCLLRGVYFKNMKWQAAIKVEKKQIHLGTVASMEEAAHLYDRAAYLCGRVPNFDLSEEEKQELQGLQWEDFLQITKEAIANKKKQKRVESCVRRRRSSESLEDGRMNSSSFHQSFHPSSRSYDDHASAHHQVASFHQLASFEEKPAFVYQHTSTLDSATFDETASVLQQAATLASFQQAQPPLTSVYEQTTAFPQQAQTLGPFHQTTALYPSECYYPPSIHQHTAFAGSRPYIQ